MANTKRDRKWVIRAMVAFVVILGLLTFFSNTIMNATIPKVTGVNSQWGRLSYTNSAQSTVELENKIVVKGIEGREVDKVMFSDYMTVEKGDVLLTLKPLEDQKELDDLKKELDDLKKQAEYDERTPQEQTDYTSLSEGVSTANRELSTAQQTLADAQNKDATIAAAQKIIDDNQATALALEAQVSSASDTLEGIKAEISEIDSQIATLDSQINVFVTLGTPTPTPYDPANPAPPPTETYTPEETTVVPNETTAGDVETAPDATDATDVPVVTEPVPTETEKDTTQIDALCQQKQELETRKAELELQLNDAQSRLDEASGQLAIVNGIIGDAQTTIDSASQLPSVAEAQSSVNLAQSSVNQAQRAYSNAQINDGIARDKAKDDKEAKEKQIEDLEEKIEKIESKLNAKEIVAPCSGTLYGIAVSSGDVMTDAAIITIIPDDPEYVVSFSFTTEAVQSLSVGSDLSVDDWQVYSCIITNIYPDPANPRDSRIVKCKLDGYLFPGTPLVATADRSNQEYKNVVPASAVNEDNSGNFVYVIKQSSGPLGDKYVVKRVTVEIEGTDGSLAAIKGEGLDEGMIVTRSEEPLHDGDRVRLEDYSGEK